MSQGLHAPVSLRCSARTVRSIQSLLAGLLACVVAASSATDIINPGFEAGIATGWTVTSDELNTVHINDNASTGSYGLTLSNDQAYGADVAQTVTGLAKGISTP